MLMEELSGSEKYSEMACAYKTKNPEMAKKFDANASDEMKHAGVIEQEIINVVKAAGAESKEAVIHEFMKKAIHDGWMRAKNAQSCYKGG